MNALPFCHRVGFGSSDWPATTWVVLQVAYFVTDQPLPSTTWEPAELVAAVYKTNQHSAERPTVSRRTLYRYLGFMMETENAPTPFYTISSNQADEQSLDSTVSVSVIWDQLSMSVELMLELEYDLASAHSITATHDTSRSDYHLKDFSEFVKALDQV